MKGFQTIKKQVMITSGIMRAFDTTQSIFWFSITFDVICMAIRNNDAIVKRIMAVFLVSSEQVLTSIYDELNDEIKKVIIPAISFFFIELYPLFRKNFADDVMFKLYDRSIINVI